MIKNVVALVLCLALIPSGVFSQARPSDPNLELAKRQVDEGDFDAAVLILDGLVKKLSAERGRQRDLAWAYMYMALAYLGLSEEAKAKARILEAIALDKELHPTRKEFPPKLVELFEQTRREAQSVPIRRTVPPRPDNPNAPAFYDAVKANDVATVRRMLDEDPSLLNHRDSQFGATPLHWAALRGNEAVAAFLIGAGADTSIANSSGETPLRVADRAGKTGVVELLRPGTAPGAAALFRALRENDAVRVEQLVRENRALIQEKDPAFGATPLHWAALKGNAEIARFLLRSGADAKATNSAGETPLAVAERAGKTEVADVLRGSAAPAAAPRAPSAPPADVGELLDAVKRGDLARVQQIVRDSPSLVNARDAQFGATPLHWAALRGNKDIVVFLIAQGADVTATNRDGETPLRVAERAGKTEVAQILRGR
jgi:ankyrin repeat protein